MRKLVLSSALLFALVGAGPAAAGPLQAGIAAYNRHDYPAAARLLLPLAQHGNPMAQTYVGFMFANGRGLPQNYVAAADWYRAASEAGVPVEHVVYPELIHGAYRMPGVLDGARRMLEDSAAALIKALGQA